MSSAIKLLAVDGFNLIRRIYEARHAVSESDMAGVAEAAAASLKRALRQHAPTHAVVVLEYHDKTWRHLLYPEYKANRGATPRLLLESLPVLEEAFSVLDVRCFGLESYEADDVIATLASRVAGAGGRSVILSTDKIYLQLISDAVRIYDHFSEKWLDEAFLQDRFHVSPAQYIDYLSLTGDRTNNVHGVPGIGHKSAIQLLSDFPDLAAILSSPEETTLVKKVKAGEREAERSRTLVTLKCDVELGANLKSFRLPQTS